MTIGRRTIQTTIAASSAEFTRANVEVGGSRTHAQANVAMAGVILITNTRR